MRQKENPRDRRWILRHGMFALVSAFPDGSLSVEGFGKQVSTCLGT